MTAASISTRASITSRSPKAWQGSCARGECRRSASTSCPAGCRRSPRAARSIAPRRALHSRSAIDAEAFLDEYSDKPFFLYVSHYAVHTRIEADPKLVAKYQAKKPSGPQTNPENLAAVLGVLCRRPLVWARPRGLRLFAQHPRVRKRQQPAGVAASCGSGAGLD